jgi:hypothetical protein
MKEIRFIQKSYQFKSIYNQNPDLRKCKPGLLTFGRACSRSAIDASIIALA